MWTIISIIIFICVAILLYIYIAGISATNAETQNRRQLADEIAQKKTAITTQNNNSKIWYATVEADPIYIPRQHHIATPSMQKREARRRKNKIK